MDEYSDALAWCEQKSARENRKYRNDFRRDIAAWTTQPDAAKFFRLVSTAKISNRALLSNVRVHRAAQNAAVTALTREYARNPGRPWLWITIACDLGQTWERAPVLDLIALRNTFSLHLRRCGIAGFGVIEIDTWKNITGEPGRRIVPHLHFVGYARDDQAIDVADLQSELTARRALKNGLGARPVDVQEVSATVTDFACVARYMMKRPAHAKNPIPQPDGTHRLRDVEHARGSVSRLVEIQSHMEVGDVIFSIGKGSGKVIADAIRSAAAHEVRHRRGAKPAPSRNQVRRHWHRMRLTNGSRKFAECTVVTRTDQRNADNDKPE